mmetsp:Transcript_52462/g.105121  ORF Transcript_52462/g.105121 Transcript_52462/m.105121 type:complete len:258 (-) Transcript_52462:254-1027(-)
MTSGLIGMSPYMGSTGCARNSALTGSSRSFLDLNTLKLKGSSFSPSMSSSRCGNPRSRRYLSSGVTKMPRSRKSTHCSSISVSTSSWPSTFFSSVRKLKKMSCLGCTGLARNIWSWWLWSKIAWPSGMLLRMAPNARLYRVKSFCKHAFISFKLSIFWSTSTMRMSAVYRPSGTSLLPLAAASWATLLQNTLIAFSWNSMRSVRRCTTGFKASKVTVLSSTRFSSSMDLTIGMARVTDREAYNICTNSSPFSIMVSI